MKKDITEEEWGEVAKEFIAARELHSFNEGMLHMINNKYALRDHFAAQAMQGLLAGLWCSMERKVSPNKGNQMLVEDAYAIADAMLKARDSDGSP